MTTHDDGLYEIDPDFSVQPRRSPDENAQAAWDQVLAVLKMLDDMIEAGARIKISKSPLFPPHINKALLVQGVANMVGRILRDAEVVE